MNIGDRIKYMKNTKLNRFIFGLKQGIKLFLLPKPV